MSLTVTTPAPVPVTLAEAKTYLRIDDTAQDGVLTALIDSATDYVARQTRTTLGVTAYRLLLDGFPSEREPLLLPRPPLAAVQLITYVDPDEQQVILDPSRYSVDAASLPGRIALKAGQTWPAVNGGGYAVAVEFTAGYAQVPDLLKQAILFLVGHWYENREAVAERRLEEVPLSVNAIIAMHAYPEAV